ncbi:hypothetical protein MKC94_15060 [[Clostridium] innocuum]|nr:hypothetical protein [[Clostridium] innocuum]
MKITDHSVLTEFSPAKVQFFRIDPEDISATLSDILRTLMDLSWLSKFDQDFEQKAFASRAKKTIDDIKEKFDKCVDDNISKDAGEYVVSELARETMVSKLDYLDIPLDELVGKKRSGNPGLIFIHKTKLRIRLFSVKRNMLPLQQRIHRHCHKSSILSEMEKMLRTFLN